MSRVLQNRGNVEESTRQRVLQALQDTGYVPNLQARAMRMRRSGLVGVVTGRITNPFYPELLDGLAQALAAADLRMALWASDEQASSTVAVQAIQGGAADGLIFTTATPTTRRSSRRSRSACRSFWSTAPSPGSSATR